jgi:hypothetical protein
VFSFQGKNFLCLLIFNTSFMLKTWLRTYEGISAGIYMCRFGAVQKGPGISVKIETSDCNFGTARCNLRFVFDSY